MEHPKELKELSKIYMHCWAQLFIMDVLKKLNIAQVKYEKAMGEARNSIADKVDFNFSVQWQPSDG